MAVCQFCENIKKKDVKIIYEDNDVLAFLKPKPCTAGHILLIPKKHYPIIEQVPDKLVGKLFTTATKLSSAVFEAMGAASNIIIQNGISSGQTAPHFSVNIIPRRENDGLNFEWLPQKLSEDQMSTAELMLKEQAKNIGFEEEKPEPLRVKEKVEKVSGEENYLIKQLERIP